MQRCWLHSLTRITDWSQLTGLHLFAAFLHLEIFRVYLSSSFKLQRCWLHSGFTYSPTYFMVYCMVYAKLTGVDENELKSLFYNELFEFY
ncbi:hypothetical protein B4901_15085 [Yersinia frederiksenii]|nr:hypothetical protein B4901_15085 [Yersinia frederiksenii]